MRTTARSTATAAAWVAAGALGATVLTGIATAAVTSGSAGPTAASASASDTTAPGRRAAMLRHVLHGSLTVSTSSGTAVVDIQRGSVTAASATSVTVKSTDGFTATYAITADTLVRRDHDTVSADALEVGDTAMVRSTAGKADVVRALSPDAVARLGAGVGQGGMGGMGGGANGAGMHGMGMGADADDA